MWRWWWIGIRVLLACVAVSAARAAETVPPSSTILIDALTGESLREQNADESVQAGSFNQLMVVLLSLEEAGMGAVPLDGAVAVRSTAASGRVAPHASPALPAKPGKLTPAPLPPLLSLQPDKGYVLSDLLKAVLLTSSNEATAAAGAAIAASIPACVELMNARAQRLGMGATHYASVAGDDAGAADTTTVRDVARLAHALVQHPPVLQWSSLNGFPFDRGATLLRNGNQLIGAVVGVDGLQVSTVSTGRALRYGIVASAQRGPLRLIAVVAGAPGSAERYAAAAEQLEWGFAHYERLEIVRKDEPLNFPIRVRHGSTTEVTPVAGKTFSLLRRRDEEHDLQLRYQLPATLTAPLRRHQQIGEIIVEEKGALIGVVPVLNPTRVRAAGILAAALP